MAFEKKRLVRESAHEIGGVPAEFSYIVEEATDITGADFFKDSGLKGGDKVTKVVLTIAAGKVTGRADTAYFIAEADNGVLTATAL